MNEINFPNVNLNFENFEIIEKKPVNFVLDDNKRGTNKINVKNTSMNLQNINSIFDQYKINEKKIQNNNDELKINSNEQKINSNEPKTNSNEIKINSNESKIIPNELNPNEQKINSNEQKINSNEQKINPDNSKIKDLYKKNNKIKRKGSYSCLEEEEEEENENNQSNLIIQNKRSESNIELQNNEFSYEILQEKPNKFDLFFKIILVGDFGVGKTSLINNSFKEFNLDNGIIEFYIKIKEQIIKVQIYDTCEQEKNNSLNSSFYRYSSLAILVYSIDNKRSFENLNKWLNEIKSNNNKDIKIFLIGNKIDLNNREVTKENGEKFKIDNNLDLFLEKSAIENNNNKENIFIEAIKQLYNENKNNNEHLNPNEIIIDPSNNNKNDDGSGEKKKNETDDRCFCDCCYKCILF
jgi:small GTP-binding protein